MIKKHVCQGSRTQKIAQKLTRLGRKLGKRRIKKDVCQGAGQGCLPCGLGIVYQDNIKDHYGEPPDQGQLGKLNMWPMP